MNRLNFNIELQRQVIRAVLDDFTPNAALPNLHGGQYGDDPEEWRKAVIEFIGAMLMGSLITPLPGKERYDCRTSEEICQLLHRGDPEQGFDTELLWDVIHFAGTDKLAALLSKLELANWEAWNGELSPALEAALKQMNIVRS